MNICMFTNTYLPHVGGVANSVRSFEQELQRHGHRVSVVAPEFEDAVAAENVLRVAAVQKFNGSDFSVRLPQPWLISDFVEDVQPDVIHSHHPFLLGDSALRAAGERRLPLVFTHHTLYEHYTHYVPLDSEPIRRFAIQMATEYANLCSHVIAPSDSIKQLLVKRGVETPITTIPTGIDLEFFGSGDARRFRRRHRIPREALIVGHVGRLAEEKNLDFLCRAVADYVGSHASAVFVIVGDGESREPLETQLRNCLPADRLVFTGKQTGQDLADAYAAMDVFAFASQSETQGMVIAEALAAGTPIVALDGPGVREVVCDQNGELLPQDATEKDFSMALAQILDDASRLGRLSEVARASAAEYGLGYCTEKLCDLYSRVIEQSVTETTGEFGPLEQLQARLETEWDLLVEKTLALSAAIMETDESQVTLS